MDSSKPDVVTSRRDRMLSFTLEHLQPLGTGPRLGRLLCSGRKAIETPHYVAATSRGVISHISHDTLRKHTAVSSIYLGLEDCKGLPSALTACADFLLTVPLQS